MVQSEVDFCVAKFRLSPKQNSAVEEDFLGRTNRVPYRQIPRTARGFSSSSHLFSWLELL